ncbi:hypothetical protein BKA62DRAFT_671156 [Auriculariales sp. MPI-PUGE-AT-0066]|nr:hypothetical protein BKA62DRAFT_671156 [Auriculariales sp. MPI-PUGE-AT-0066]
MSERLGSGVALGVTKMMLFSESELDALSMCESSSAKVLLVVVEVVVDYVIRRPCTGLDKVRNTVKDVPWGTEVFGGLGCSPEIVGLHPKGRRVQCAIEAHRARGRRAVESNTDMNGEDYNRRRIYMFGGIGLCSEEHMYIEMGTWSVAMINRVLTMMAGAQPGGLAMYQVKVQEPRRGTEA